MNQSFYYSLIAHIFAICLLFVSMPSFQKEQIALDSVPILIDLKNIEIAQKTNLPPLVKAENKEKSAALKEKASKDSQPSQTVEAVKPVQKTVTKEDAIIVEDKKTSKEKIKVMPKAKPKVVPKPKATPKSAPWSKPSQKQEDGLDSLLASVEKMGSKSKKTDTKTSQKQDISDVVGGVLNGIEGGTTRLQGTKLTVSQIDFIASSVRKHWNLDAGIEGVQDMVIEIRVRLTQSGRVYGVDFLNQNRYNSDASFRSVAESARRAIYICDKLGEESPFRMLAEKYPSSYTDWQNMTLRFNSLDGGVS